MLDSIKFFLGNLAAVLAAFFSGFSIGSLKQKNKHLKEKKDDADKDAAIANEPSKHGSDLLDGLQRRD